MDDDEEYYPGAFGSGGSLGLRVGQLIFSLASLLFMCIPVEFYGFTSFCFLVTIMGLVFPWSLTLAIIDAISILVKRPPRQVGIVTIVTTVDWILSLLSLAAACSTASVTIDVIGLGPSGASLCMGKSCLRYQLSAVMALLTWGLSLASSLFNLWFIPSLLL